MLVIQLGFSQNLQDLCQESMKRVYEFEAEINTHK